jgi:maltose alpha-D-glucosyltransferase/alpha-amylase
MGDNVFLGDRNGVRTPMQWSPDRNAGFSTANPQQLYLPVIIDPEYHYEVVNVETQRQNAHSLLWWTKRLIAMRKQFKAFGRGKTEFLHPENTKILAFIRHYEDENVMVVANLSRFVQYVELDLSTFSGMVPVELFGQTRFPVIEENPFPLTLGPHSFYWFSLEKARAQEMVWQPEEEGLRLPHLKVSGRWTSVFDGRAKGQLEKILSQYLQKRRWFGGKAQGIRTTKIHDIISLKGTEGCLLLLDVLYGSGDAQNYLLPVAYASLEKAESLIESPASPIARMETTRPKGEGILYDGVMDPSLCAALLDTVVKRRVQKGQVGRIVGRRTKALSQVLEGKPEDLESSVSRAEQSNTSIVFDDQAIFKLFRRLDAGINPDWEIGRFLTEAGFEHIPSVAGAIEYFAGKKTREVRMTFGILEGYVSNANDAWSYTKNILDLYFEGLLTQRPDLGPAPATESGYEVQEETAFMTASTIIGPYLDFARLLGRRTAQLHVTLASGKEKKDFKPEPFSQLYQRALYQAMRSNAVQTFRLVQRQKHKFPPESQPDAEAILKGQAEILDRLGNVARQKIEAYRTRCHGDFHLGQVLYTGKDCVIIDFEGEPARPLTERRIKSSPLKDVAGMLRSFHYAVSLSLGSLREKEFVYPEDDEGYLEKGAKYWYEWICFAYLFEYVRLAADGAFLPPTIDQFHLLLDAYLLDKAFYELRYEIENRPDWVAIPCEGILQLAG